MMKLRIATGLGLLVLMATMIGGPVRVSHAQDGEGHVTLADLAGKFSARGNGFFTVCFYSGSLVDCASFPNFAVPFNTTQIQHTARDTSGHTCGVATSTSAPVFGTRIPAGVTTATIVSKTNSFDPTTGSGTTSFSQYHGGSRIGAAFDGGGTLTGTGTATFVVSDSGNRIESILTSFSAVTSAFNTLAGSVQGNVYSQTAIRQ